VGTYMELRSAELLIDFMKHRDNMKTVELARYADVSKQFISRLRMGHDKTCKPETAERIERALGVPPGALFVEKTSTTGGGISKQRRRAA
jgi:DNA-binding Xre family transcriptional regulator